MRTQLNIIDGKGTTKKLALFSGKSNSGFHVVVRTDQSADPVASIKATNLSDTSSEGTGLAGVSER